MPASALPTMEEIASDAIIDQAYAWLCERRKDYSANNDVWDVRWRWATLKPQLQAELVAGRYRLGAVDRIHIQEAGDETTREVWAALDALVLKATAIVVTRYLEPQLSPNCYHLPGHGGAKAAVRAVAEHLDENTFVFRTDVKSYYASIEHDTLFGLLQASITDARLLALVWSAIHRTVYDGGNYQDILRGIGLGCPISPLLGAIYLKQLDEQMPELDVFYARFMDDWVILAPTRWKLRAAIKRVNETLAALGLEKHPDKTSIGRITHGFIFLGYTFSPAGLGIAQLYEQGADAVRIGQYARRWWRWVRAGVTLQAEELAGWRQGLLDLLAVVMGELDRVGGRGCDCSRWQAQPE